MSPPRILHLHAAFDSDASAQRCAGLIGALPEAEHAVVSDDPARRSAAALIGKQSKVVWPRFPSLAGKPWPGRLKRLAQAMAGYDLICTYRWGGIDAALAHTLFADVYKLAPLVHHEDEAGGRSFYRRIALGRTAALVVPTRALERIALGAWQQPRARVRLIPDGIATRAYAAAPRRDALPRVIKHKGELWIGTLAAATGDVLALVRALARLPEEWQLVAIDEAADERAILAEAERLGIEDRVHLPGPLPDPAKPLRLFDLFALPAGADQLRAVEAMAAGVTLVAPDGGDAAAVVASENGPFLANLNDAARLDEALGRLTADAALRKRIGDANRARAQAEFDEAVMAARYQALYRSLMGRR